MKTATSRPDVRATTGPTENGENQSSCGVSAPSPSPTRTSATTANAASVTISAASSQRCVRALTSTPITQTAVMIAIQTTPTAVTASVDGASTPKSRNEYSPAIWARLAITIRSATMIAQPPIQPVSGPKARVAQAKVVPASGSALFMYLEASATRSI